MIQRPNDGEIASRPSVAGKIRPQRELHNAMIANDRDDMRDGWRRRKNGSAAGVHAD